MMPLLALHWPAFEAWTIMALRLKCSVMRTPSDALYRNMTLELRYRLPLELMLSPLCTMPPGLPSTNNRLVKWSVRL